MQLPVPPITGFHTLLILRTISGLFLLLSSLWTLMSRNSCGTAYRPPSFIPPFSGWCRVSRVVMSKRRSSGAGILLSVAVG